MNLQDLADLLEEYADGRLSDDADGIFHAFLHETGLDGARLFPDTLRVEV